MTYSQYETFHKKMVEEVTGIESDDLGFSQNDYDSPDFDPLAELIKRNKGINQSAKPDSCALGPLAPPEWPPNLRLKEF